MQSCACCASIDYVGGTVSTLSSFVMVEAYGVQSKTILENVKQEWVTVNKHVDRHEAAIHEQMEPEWSRTEAAEARIEGFIDRS